MAQDTPRSPSFESPTLGTNKQGSFPRNNAGSSRGFASGIKSTFRRTPKKNQRKRIARVTWKDRMRDRLSSFYQHVILEMIFRQKPLPPSKEGRHIPLNPTDVGSKGLIDERSDKPYISNFIRSSRYTLWNFIPLQLIYQFSKLGNFYFLVIGIIQMIPGLSTVGRWTTIVPLAGFVAFSMAKEGYDDWRRYQLDKQENRSVAWVLDQGVRSNHSNRPKRFGGGPKWQKLGPEKEQRDQGNEAFMYYGSDGWMTVQWQHIQVGDVIRLRRDDAVPADIALLHATGPNGIAYIDTMALDGETNLKSKQACPLFAERCSTAEYLRATRAVVVSEDPNLDLYSYDGKVMVDNETLPLTMNNVVYRGSTIRNTSMVIGLVINSGEECKIRMNANKNVHAKKPAMQSIVNNMVLIQMVGVIALTAGLTGGYYLWKDPTEQDSFYLYSRGQWNASVPFTEIFFGYLVMFNTLIPLSLYISLEIIKIGQFFMMLDAELYDPVSDTPMVANTTTILENLGQVTHIFSDKTGTLTENIMRFRKMSVAGVACLHDMDVQKDENAKQQKIDARKAAKGKDKVPPYPPPDRDYAAAGSDNDWPLRKTPQRTVSSNSRSQWRSSVYVEGRPEMKTEDLLAYIRRKPNSAVSRKAKHFLLCIALCHTCLPEINDSGELAYQAASPDELALIEAARDLGFLLVDRPSNSIKLQTTNANGMTETETYQVLDVIEFSSKRKRMSIVVRMPDGRISVICKGADNVIMARLRQKQLADEKARDIGRRTSVRRTQEQEQALSRLSSHEGNYGSPRNSLQSGGYDPTRRESFRQSLGRKSTDRRISYQDEVGRGWSYGHTQDDLQSPMESDDPSQTYENLTTNVDESIANNEAAIFEKCFQDIDDFASEGLRTLLYAYRYIDEDVYRNWKQVYHEAETSLVDRQQRIEEASELIEQKFELAGATAIEDKLQDGVPNTIDKLRRGNIKVWMLTGDKRETAINIGHSARLCKAFSTIFILDFKEDDNLHETMAYRLGELSRGEVAHSVMVVDGETLAFIDADEELAYTFYDLAVIVDSVICCRASPAQKAQLVKKIRRFVPSSMTLAIGDGANDIGMIQASHVGIGVSGREGLQAARISDYSIAQFRFLQKLLFVHGRWNYLRTGKYVLGTFWKEILFFLVQAHYQRYNGYSGTSLYEEWSLTVFNILFTSLPVILMGIFEKDLSADTLMAVPELYTFGQNRMGFNYVQYLGWVIMGVAGSFVIFYFMYAEYQTALFQQDAGIFAIGVICFTVAVTFINVKLLILETHSKSIIIIIGFCISIAGWFLWNIILSRTYARQVGIYVVRNGFLEGFGGVLSWWVTIALALVTLIVMELVVQAIRRVYWPTDQDLMQRIEKDAEATRLVKDRAAAAERGDVELMEMQDVTSSNDASHERKPPYDEDSSNNGVWTASNHSREERRQRYQNGAGGDGFQLARPQPTHDQHTGRNPFRDR